MPDRGGRVDSGRVAAVVRYRGEFS